MTLCCARDQVYTTPKSFLDLISLYMSLLEDKRKEVRQQRDRLAKGVTILEETNSMVDGLKEELKALQPVLKQKAVEAEDLLKKVNVEKKEAEKVRVNVEAEEQVVKKQAHEAGELQADAQKDLDKVR